jgi:hypothetical protein|tara:strand:+ start:68 stop:655 length:588 start_codon:yes stop_codon:yes gene_type:complete
MRLRELFEAPGETVGLIFGRFNPPHKGHKAAWEMASQETYWYVGTNMATIGPKDPLPFQIKIKAMETIWPEVRDHIIASQSWLTLASELYTKHPESTLVLFTDEQWVPKTLQQYNGQEGPHGSYNFQKIVTKATPRLSSATALRKAVLDNSPEEFADAAGVPADTKIDVPGEDITFFDMVAKYLEPHREKLLAKK